MPHPVWPLFDLEVHTPRLSLRYVDDELGARLADLAARGVHDPTRMPFSIPWTDVEPPRQQVNTLQFYWRCRADTGPAAWNLPLAVLVDGEVVGSSGIVAHDFAITREGETGSWVGRSFQGRGLGRELREATLHLLFEGFGAQAARSAAFADSSASIAVSRRLGYLDDGTATVARRGEAAVQQRFLLPRERWVAIRRDDIQIVGLAPCLPLLGL